MYGSRTSLSMLDRNTMNAPGGHNKHKGNITMYGNGELSDEGRPTCCFGMFGTTGRNATSEVDPSEKLPANS